MFYDEKQMEEKAVLETAAKMCAAARTAPKAKGVDNIVTVVLTGKEKDELADKMEEVYLREFGETEGHYVRDGRNLRASDAVVLIGVKKAYTGLPHCSFCGFENCSENKKLGGRCAFNTLDLGIAIGSAVSVAADNRVDSRVMFSIGKVAEEMDYAEGEDILWEGIPISISGKSPYFDRVKK
ncbi:DUF2148 domain-containing protein [uncultured Anaerofustis sp.]|uniref:ferredoxin domain-containing protein n=1 Tax=uncultured Anaerofustis sp. TaxID=904996 RepID=UPI0025F5CACD|nr:DUF2148 domain-containing protein [uncultured Anaerofustis sp.]